MLAAMWVLALRRATNVSNAKTTGVCEGYHRFLKGKLRLWCRMMHQRRLDSICYFLFKVMNEHYNMRALQSDIGAA